MDIKHFTLRLYVALLSKGKYLSVAGLYLLISVAFTYPLISSLDTGIYGYPGDSTNVIWSIWADTRSLLDGSSWGELIGLPFGFDTTDRIFTPYSYAILAVALLRNEVFAYNLFIFATFPVSALAAYHLALKMTRTPSASFIAGLIYSFGPYHLWTARNHLTFDPQWIPLFLVALLHFEDRPTWRRALLAALLYSLVVMVNPYYGFFAAIATVVVVLCRAAYHRRCGICKPFLTRTRLLCYSMAVTVALFLTTWTYWPVFRTLVLSNPGDGEDHFKTRFDGYVDIAYVTASPQPVQRGSWWPFYGSARPWDYLLPSEDHLVFGSLTREITLRISEIDRGNWVPDKYRYLDLDNWWFWQDTGPGGELFLGYTGILLGGYALHHFWSVRRRESRRSEARFGVLLFALLALVAIWFSMPPWFPIGSLFSKWLPSWADNWIIPSPMWYSFRVLPMFRAGVRFGVLVLLSVSVLAAIGYVQVLKRVSSHKTRLTLTIGVSALVIFEFVSVPPHTQLYPAPNVYYWLASHPRKGTLASYPWNYSADVFYQTIHQMPLAGRTPWLPFGQFEAHLLGNIRDSDTPSKLAAIGVKHVLWHLQNPLVTIPANRSDDQLVVQQPLTGPISGLYLEHTFPTAQVFEVIAEPAELVVLSGPHDAIWISNPDLSWQDQHQTVWIWNPTNETIDVEVDIELKYMPNTETLIATLELTPPPSHIIVDGAYLENPLANLKYGSTTFPSTLDSHADPRLRFATLPILPGETKVQLDWDKDTIHPVEVTDIIVTTASTR